MTPQFEEFITLVLDGQNAPESSDNAHLKNGFRTFLQACGIEYFDYGAFRMDNGRAGQPYFADSNFPDAWLEEYFYERFGPDDYVLSRAKTHKSKSTSYFILGDWLAPRLDDVNQRTGRILRGAGDAGMKDGVGIVGVSRQNCGADGNIHWGFGMGGDYGTGKHAQNQIAEIKIAGAMLMDHLLPEIGSAIDGRFKPLSSRERDVLGCMAKGLQRDRTAHQVGISMFTVDHHCKNLREKLVASTMIEALAKAFRYGQI